MKVFVVLFECPPSRSYVIDVFRSATSAWDHAANEADKLVRQNPGSVRIRCEGERSNGYEVRIKRSTWMQSTSFLVNAFEVGP